MRLILILFLLLTTTSLFAQQYSRAKVYANPTQMQNLLEQGVPVDEGSGKFGVFVISDFSSDELAVIQSLGLEYEILIPDVVQYYRRNLSNTNSSEENDQNRGLGCLSGGTIINYDTPANFALGNMGGYLTYDEFIENLDSMASKFPSLIAAKQEIDSSGVPFSTHDSNPIYWVRISDNPNTDELSEPEILYTALHHAREPASLSQLIFYMWYLLENYGTDDEVTYIVDNMELYFVPMVNPDGYRHNESVVPGGGGLWRKNRRNNGGSYGVDLNRNYSYQWGVSGSSTNPTSNTYMGPSSFSEPETRAIKKFCEDHDFQIAQNAHTHGNLLLYPFGYALATPTPDNDIFVAWSSRMVSQNGFANILSSELYPASGDSDDWMYAGDLGTKPKIFAMTPEIGSDDFGFWPPSTEIHSICHDMVFENLATAHFLKVYGLARDENPNFINASSGFLKYNIQRYGLESGTLTVAINPVGFGIASIGSSNTYNFATILDQQLDSIAYTLEAGLSQGQSFQYEITVSNGLYTWRDTITKIFGTAGPIYSNNASSMADWITTGWGTSTVEFVSAPSSISESPVGSYGNYTNSTITLAQTVDLTDAIAANIRFYALWDIEDNFDYCQLQVSADNGTTWTPMCGLYTETGTSDQDPGEPLWDGTQSTWVQEEISLIDFLGSEIIIQFVFISDAFVTGDGFYFDDFEILTIESNGINENNFILGEAYPNPTSETIVIPYTINSEATLEILDITGKSLSRKVIREGENQVTINTSDLAPGVYLYRVLGSGESSVLKRFVVIENP